MHHTAPNPVVSRATGLSFESKRKKRDYSVTIISHNVRGMKREDQIDELFFIMQRRGIFAACVQETWRTGIQTLEHDQCRLILAGLDTAQVKTRRGSQGVGIALSAQATAA